MASLCPPALLQSVGESSRKERAMTASFVEALMDHIMEGTMIPKVQIERVMPDPRHVPRGGSYRDAQGRPGSVRHPRHDLSRVPVQEEREHAIGAHRLAPDQRAPKATHIRGVEDLRLLGQCQARRTLSG